MLSLDRLPATTHAYLINFVGIVTMLMSIVILKERPSVFQIVGAALAIAGLRVFFREIPLPSEFIGVIYVAIAVLALASYNNIARKLAIVTSGGLSNTIISTVALWIGGFPVVLAGLMIDWPPPVASWTNWGIILLNGIVGIAIGLTLFNYVLRTLRSYEASILAGSGVIYTAILAVPILSERLALHQIVGIAMMLVGLSLAQVRRERLPRRKREILYARAFRALSMRPALSRIFTSNGLIRLCFLRWQAEKLPPTLRRHEKHSCGFSFIPRFLRVPTSADLSRRSRLA
jgi:drug/metabolite transporter (DMT)-like permease